MKEVGITSGKLTNGYDDLMLQMHKRLNENKLTWVDRYIKNSKETKSAQNLDKITKQQMKVRNKHCMYVSQKL